MCHIPPKMSFFKGLYCFLWWLWQHLGCMTSHSISRSFSSQGVTNGSTQRLESVIWLSDEKMTVTNIWPVIPKSSHIFSRLSIVRNSFKYVLEYLWLRIFQGIKSDLYILCNIRRQIRVKMSSGPRYCFFHSS